ncbi:hypothetical protein [Sorangium sp. So ce1000]
MSVNTWKLWRRVLEVLERNGLEDLLWHFDILAEKGGLGTIGSSQ